MNRSAGSTNRTDRDNASAIHNTERRTAADIDTLSRLSSYHYAHVLLHCGIDPEGSSYFGPSASSLVVTGTAVQSLADLPADRDHGQNLYLSAAPSSVQKPAVAADEIPAVAVAEMRVPAPDDAERPEAEPA
jgi:hypothetical protein